MAKVTIKCETGKHSDVDLVITGEYVNNINYVDIYLHSKNGDDIGDGEITVSVDDLYNAIEMFYLAKKRQLEQDKLLSTK